MIWLKRSVLKSKMACSYTNRILQSVEGKLIMDYIGVLMRKKVSLVSLILFRSEKIKPLPLLMLIIDNQGSLHFPRKVHIKTKNKI